MTDKQKLEAIGKYIRTTRKVLDSHHQKDWEYTTKLGNGVNISEACLMFDEVEEEINKILKDDK